MHGEDITEIGQKCFTLQAIYRKIRKVPKDLILKKHHKTSSEYLSFLSPHGALNW